MYKKLTCLKFFFCLLTTFIFVSMSMADDLATGELAKTEYPLVNIRNGRSVKAGIVAKLRSGEILKRGFLKDNWFAVFNKNEQLIKEETAIGYIYAPLLIEAKQPETIVDPAKPGLEIEKKDEDVKSPDIVVIEKEIKSSPAPSSRMIPDDKKNKRKISILDAVQDTIIKHPDIMAYKEQIEDRLGKLQSEKGPFDVKLETIIGHSYETNPTYMRDRVFDPREERETENTAYNINLSKKYRTGIEVSSGISVSRNEILVNPNYLIFPDYTDDPTYDGRAKLIIKLPLLKGRGKISNTANEIAAEKEYRISLFELRHRMSKNIFDTVVAYWKYLAANRSLDQLKASENRAENFLKETKIFIAAGQNPASDLEQTAANLANKFANRIAGEQQYYQEQINLGLSMGLSIEQIKNLDSPVDDFYKFDRFDLLELIRGSDRLIKESMSRRADYLLLLEKQKQSKVLLKAAENNLLPQLDLDTSLGYSGLDEGDSASSFISSLEKNGRGLNYSITINYKYYFANNNAKGYLRQRQSQYKQTLIATDDIIKKISASILVSLSDLRKSALKLTKTRETVKHYTIALKNEKKKFKLGRATLLDVLQTEENLTQSLLRNISIQLEHSLALAQLYYNTGSFLDQRKNTFSVALFKKPKDLFDSGR